MMRYGVSANGHCVVEIGPDGEPAKRGQRPAGDEFPTVCRACTMDDAKKIAMLLNADEIQRRRGWFVELWVALDRSRRLVVVDNNGDAVDESRQAYPTTAAAICAAEEWMLQQESANAAS